MDLREQLADIEHQRWAGWQLYLHSKCRRPEELEPGIGPLDRDCLIIPTKYVEALELLANTPYSELSEEQRANDLKEVDRYWDLVEPMSRVQLLRDLVEESLKPHGHLDAKVCRHCGWVSYPKSKGPRHSSTCLVAIVEKFLGR